MKKKFWILIVSICWAGFLTECQANGAASTIPQAASVIRPFPPGQLFAGTYSETMTVPGMDLVPTATPPRRNTPTQTRSPSPAATNTRTLNPASSLFWTTYSETREVSHMAFDAKNNLWTEGSGGLESWNIITGEYRKYRISGFGGKINDMASGPDDAMWLATNEGVVQFKGEQWTFFKKGDGLADNSVDSVTRGPDGAMWFGTGGGVSKWDGGRWTSYTGMNGILDSTNSIVIDHQGTVWAASREGLSSYDGKDWKIYPFDWGRGGGGGYVTYPTDLAVAPNGTVWGASDFFLFHIQGGKIISDYLHEAYARYGTPTITDIAFGPDGALWVTTDGHGIVRFDGTTWVNYSKVWGLLDEWDWTTVWTSSVLMGPDNAMWFGTAGYGVIRFDGESWKPYCNDGLRYPGITAVAAGKDNAMWFGTEYSGAVSRFDGKFWRTYVFANDTKGMHINAIMATSDGDIWVGGSQTFAGDSGGLVRFHNQEWATYTTPRRAGSDSILSIAEGSEGILWFGTAGYGLVRFDGKEWKNYTTEDGLPSNWIRGMVFGPGGVLWSATDKGVSRFDGKQWTTYTAKSGLAYDFADSIGMDLLGNIWITSEDVASYFDGKKWVTAFKAEFDVEYTRFVSIASGPDGSMWFGTEGPYEGDRDGNGVFRYKNGAISIYRPWDGLAGDRVWSITVGPDGAMWFGTDGGVSRFDWINSP
jgi:ligand-binding sensor domain-containing protein